MLYFSFLFNNLCVRILFAFRGTSVSPQHHNRPDYSKENFCTLTHNKIHYEWNM